LHVRSIYVYKCIYNWSAFIEHIVWQWDTSIRNLQCDLVIELTKSLHGSLAGCFWCTADATCVVTNTLLKHRREQNTRIIRALGVLGVIYPTNTRFQVEVMNLRAVTPLSAEDVSPNSSDLLIFSLEGGCCRSEKFKYSSIPRSAWRHHSLWRRL